MIQLGSMHQTNIDFAPGTPQEYQKIVQLLGPPSNLYTAYRIARAEYKTGDVVLVVGVQEPEVVDKFPRDEYVKRALSKLTPAQRKVCTIVHKSAHQIMKLPFESDAFWLVVEIDRTVAPITCVMHATRSVKADDTIFIDS